MPIVIETTYIRGVSAISALTQTVPLHELVFKLPHPEPVTDIIKGIVAKVTVKLESHALFIRPKVDGLFFGSIRLQGRGSYEYYHGMELNFRGYTWTFRFIHAHPCSECIYASYVVPNQADFEVVCKYVNNDGKPKCKGSIPRNELVGTFRKVPLWLPGLLDVKSDDGWFQRQLFFNKARIMSSWDTDVAISYPYGPTTRFLPTLQALPESVSHLHLRVLDFGHLNLMKRCLLAASRASFIRSVTVSGSVDKCDFTINADTCFEEGNLTTLSWINIDNDSACNLVIAALAMNPNIQKLAIGGQCRYIMEILKHIRHSSHLDALEMHISDSPNPRKLIQILRPSKCPIQELAVFFKNNPKPRWLRSFCELFQSTLIKVTIIVTDQQLHTKCNSSCRANIFPLAMPALKQVVLENVRCSRSAMSQSLQFSTVEMVSIQVAKDDASMISCPLALQAVPVSVHTLSVSPKIPTGLFNYNWNSLNTLTVHDLQLDDIPPVLEIAKSVSKLTLTILPPSQQIMAPVKSTGNWESTIADCKFVGDGRQPCTIRSCTIRSCKRLETLKIVFHTRPQDEWLYPTLGLRMVTHGLAYLHHLGHVELNEISSGLMAVLNAQAGPSTGFSFKATLHSAIPRCLYEF